MPRRARTLILLALLVLATTGCLKLDVSIEVNDDGSGSFVIVEAVDPERVRAVLGPLTEAFAAEDLTGAEDSGAEAADALTDEAICAEFFAEDTDVPPEVTVTPYEEDGRCGRTLTGQFGPGDDVAATLNDLLDEEGTAEDPASASEEDLILRKEGENWRFEAPFTIDDEVSGSEESEFLPPEILADLYESFEIRFAVRLPGKPLEHNATEVDGNLFIWDVDIEDAPDRLFAVTEPGDPGSGSSGSSDSSSTDSSSPSDSSSSSEGGSASASSGEGDDGGGGKTWLWVLIGVVAAGAAIAAFVIARSNRQPAALGGPGGALFPPIEGGAGIPPLGANAPALPPAQPTTPPQPTWDPARNAWTVVDPARGLLVHDPTTGEWRPA